MPHPVPAEPSPLAAPGGPSEAPREPALARMRISGPALVAYERRLREGPLSPLGHSLVALDLALRPSGRTTYEEAWRAVLDYGTSASAADAETCAHDVLDAFVRAYAGKPRLRWLSEITVARPRGDLPNGARADGTRLDVHGTLPRGWVAGLLEANDAPLDEAPDAGAPAPDAASR